MLIVGLTGGIGSGKSTVASLFQERGIPIIDADLIARSLCEKNASAYDQIVAHFSEHILLANGNLNRRLLREIIFARPHERRWLEGLLHPLIREKIIEQLKSIQADICIVVIPLLLENQGFPFINRILLVDSTRENQINRVVIRDQINSIQVQNILRSQLSREEKLKRADDIIDNNASLVELVPQVDQLLDFYKNHCVSSS